MYIPLVSWPMREGDFSSSRSGLTVYVFFNTVFVKKGFSSKKKDRVNDV